MANAMTPNDYQSAVMRTAPTKYPSMNGVQPLSLQHILHAQLGISSESGEIADAVKKSLAYRQPLDLLNIKEECGDLLWYISLMLEGCGYTLEDCMAENIDKLKLRYPEKFTEQDAFERKDKK